MKSTSSSTCEPRQLSKSLLHQLNSYALAATAAGVTSLALVQPAEARIVYTPAHVKILPPQRFDSTIVLIDLNHDGIDDFFLSNFFGGSAPNSYAFLNARPEKVGNRVLEKKGAASALPAGVRVQFHNSSSNGFMAGYRIGGSEFTGQWANGGKGVKDRYLGLRFIVKGQIHFGWVRLNVTFKNGEFSGLLTGYAYETIPNKPIITGRTKESEEDGGQFSPTSRVALTREPATLGLLAMGSSGLTIWRRE